MEEDLLRRAINGEKGAIEALYDRHAPVLLGVCLRYCGNRDDAEDVLHDGFIKIIRSIGTFRIRKDGTPEAWMRRVIVNTALNFLRARQKERIFTTLETHADQADPGGEDEETPMEHFRQLDREQIMNLVCGLPAGYRSVFNLYVFEQYGHREIAELLGCSENTSKSQLSKARALLRKKMNELINLKTKATYEKA